MQQAAKPAIVGTPIAQILTQCRDKPTVYDGVRPDLCPQLKQIILDRMQRDRGRKTGSLNVGGWKSGEDLFSWSDAAVQELRASICDLVGARSIAWAMVNRAGSHHPRHQHRAAMLSGVYYVTTGSPSIPTVYECPCDGRPKDYAMAIDPHPGRLVICRGETWHFLPKYMGDLPRITIAFDVRR